MTIPVYNLRLALGFLAFIIGIGTLVSQGNRPTINSLNERQMSRV